MKKMLLPLHLLCAALLVSFGVSAQNPTIYLGSANELKSQLSPTTGNNAKNTAPTLTLPVGDQDELTVEVNHQSGNSLIGKVQQNDQSDFFIQFNGNDVKGNIILKNENLAYKIFSDASGNVYLEATDINKVLCVEHPTSAAQPSTAKTQAATPSNVYNLQSLPSATAVAYMDFDGEYVVGTYWNGGAAIDAAPSGMTNDDIYLAWQITSEDYRAFNINITTDVNVFNAAPVGKRMRIIITPTWDAMPNSGGVAYIGSFPWTNENPCWAFTTGVGTGGKNIGEVSSHELGHTLGLVHDGRDFPDGGHEEYYGGQYDWAPIMGVSYGASLGQWSTGEYQYANNHEDDISIITSQNGFTFRNDEFGNTVANAGTLQVATDGSVSADLNNGLITDRNDVDVIAFTTTGGQIQLDIAPSEVYPDLDLYVALLNSQGVIIASSDPAGPVAASLTSTLVGGTYYLRIDGVGYNDPLTNGYSDYSSIGYYSISGTINGNVGTHGPDVKITSPANNATFTAGSNITIDATATDNDGTVTKVTFYKNGTEVLFEDFTAPYSYTWTNVPAGIYAISAVATDNSLMSGIDLIYVNVNPSNTCTTPAWSATTTYGTPGQRVSYNGNIFENKWWTLNETPNINDQWGVWKYISSCSSNRAPVIAFTAPAKNSVFQENSTITLTADAVDPDGSVSRVNFYKGAFFSDFLTTAPYTLTKTLPPGSYVYSAKAIDNLGLEGDAAFVNFVVNALPTASFILPHENDAYPLGGNLTISLNAGDTDGNVTKIEFFLGSMGNKVGEDVSAPYSITSIVPPATSAQGNYLPVIAKIYDNNGGIIVISTFITVTPSVNQCLNVAQYVGNGGYTAGSIVKNAGNRYECKPWPYSGWCNAAAVAYAPGTGTNWQDAWTLLGSCGASAPLSVGSSVATTSMFSVSPNPANSSIKVEYPQNGHSTLQLSDAMGNQILSQEFTSGNSVDLSSLPAGVYILQIRTEGENYTQRVIKY